jgi:hypothetical protein
MTTTSTIFRLAFGRPTTRFQRSRRCVRHHDFGRSVIGSFKSLVFTGMSVIEALGEIAPTAFGKNLFRPRLNPDEYY